jgi:hypothetical protein
MVACGRSRTQFIMNLTHDSHPEVLDPALVGTYPASAKAGGGSVWDAVLEYRVWCYPRRGADDLCDGDDYFYSFVSFAEASEFSERTRGAQSPLALIIQEEYIDEPSPGEFRYVRERRVAEWPVEFLSRPRRTARTIQDFFAPDAPVNRVAILRGQG